ncbi:symmetrical bis(5'-nucleosyl)-tetraphosphatase [Leeia sp. TBRC 13508]|uniref:bis(5'-nucleosyl)-tetraphosphatase (symmetrical) n=1 Tax=Leeia speluncae TaxID=2884804 RepID=A0ABS8D601_9NEIS|nr:symmetrical bis(5'-nucleosyl)-tetraphosphatase [Leeia speluncae]MCB6183401.1 symmetrical bis(5'-nucleosyl)-tetraphosphatase [Leeia speluncae]
MATYVIGDLQGCFSALQLLLSELNWQPETDRLVFVGDLVNRGQGSLETLRFIRQLGDKAGVVLGNHDLFLLAASEGHAKIRDDDTITPILEASDREELLAWLREQPLARMESGHLIVHAGLLPTWSAKQALSLAKEVSKALRGKKWQKFLAKLWGNKPGHWDDALEGDDRLRVIVNAMTRLRFVDEDGDIDFKYKGEIEGAPSNLTPWFDAPNRQSADTPIIFGHWSALGLKIDHPIYALDTGAIWGGKLTAMCLEDKRIIQVDCSQLPDAIPLMTE